MTTHTGLSNQGLVAALGIDLHPGGLFRALVDGGGDGDDDGPTELFVNLVDSKEEDENEGGNISFQKEVRGGSPESAQCSGRIEFFFRAAVPKG